MSAIITDQLRIVNSGNFVAGVASTSNSYYVWIGLPNATEFDEDWNETPPAPKDSFSEETDYWDTICLLYTSPSPRDATLSRMPSSA